MTLNKWYEKRKNMRFYKKKIRYWRSARNLMRKNAEKAMLAHEYSKQAHYIQLMLHCIARQTEYGNLYLSCKYSK